MDFLPEKTDEVLRGIAELLTQLGNGKILNIVGVKIGNDFFQLFRIPILVRLFQITHQCVYQSRGVRVGIQVAVDDRHGSME